MALEREIKLQFPECVRSARARCSHRARRRAGATAAAGRPARHRRRIAARARLRAARPAGARARDPDLQGARQAVRREGARGARDSRSRTPRSLVRILNELGFGVWFRYEKYREEFAGRRCRHRGRRNADRHVRRDRGQRTRASGRPPPPLGRGRVGLHPRLVSASVRRLLRQAAAAGDRHAVHPMAERCLHALVLDGRSRHPTRPADARPGQAGDAGRRRAAGPAHRPLASSAQSVTNLVLNLHHLPATIAAVVGDGQRSRRCGSLLVGAAGRSSAAPAGPALALPLIEAATFVDRQRRHADRRRSGRRWPRRTRLQARWSRWPLMPNREPHKYGGVRLTADGGSPGSCRAGAAAEGSFHFIGVQIVEAEAFRTVPTGSHGRSSGRNTGHRNAGIYDDLVVHQQGRVRGVVVRDGLSGHRHRRRLLRDVAGAFGPAPGPQRSQGACGVDRPVSQRDPHRSSGTMSRSAPGVASTTASSPTVCACRQDGHFVTRC